MPLGMHTDELAFKPIIGNRKLMLSARASRFMLAVRWSTSVRLPALPSGFYVERRWQFGRHLTNVEVLHIAVDVGMKESGCSGRRRINCRGIIPSTCSMSDLPTEASRYRRITPGLVSAKVEKSISAFALSHDTGVVRRKSGSEMCAVSRLTCPLALVTLMPLCSRKAQRLSAS